MIISLEIYSYVPEVNWPDSELEAATSVCYRYQSFTRDANRMDYTLETHEAVK